MFRISNIRGSVMVMALFFTAILTIVGAISFGVIQQRYRQVHQTASWHEALLAAEAGIDIAINEMRKQLYDPSHAWKGWSSDPSAVEEVEVDPTDGEVFYTSKVLLREGEGGQRSYSRITVDAPAFLRDSTGEQWYRVRALGIAEVPGGAVATGDKADLRLRKFSLKKDRRSGEELDSPHASRLIEAIVKPVGAFRVALFGIRSINLNNHNIVVDSYNPDDPAKSTNQWYDPAKRGENGNIATNGTLIEAGNAHIYGSASTNGGTVLNSANVAGEIRNDFFQEVFSVVRPNVQPDPYTPTTINGSEVLQAKPNAPSQYQFNRIQLSGQSTLHVQGAADGSPTFAQIVVTGDVSTSGQAQITLGKGVHLRMFVAGDIDITGNGVQNPNSPLHLQVYGLDRPTNPDGSPIEPGDAKIAGNGGFRGTVYAPMYNVEMVGGGNADSIFGAFVGWTVRMTGVQAVHYDERLGDGGLVADYKVVSWFEDVR
jgi:hypothetical protein